MANPSSAASVIPTIIYPFCIHPSMHGKYDAGNVNFRHVYCIMTFIMPTKELLTRRKTIILSIAFVLFWVPVIIFSRLAGEVLEKKPIFLDSSILNWIHAQSSPALDVFFLIITTLGNAEVILPLTLLLTAYLIYKKQRLNAFVLLVSVGGAAAANTIIKALFQRERPTFWQSAITETSYSFPSGHAAISCALLLSVMFIAWRTKWRWLAIIGGGLIIGLIGVSRLYMGVHYPTDVAAGWSVGLAWVLIVTSIAYGWSRRNRPPIAE